MCRRGPEGLWAERPIFAIGGPRPLDEVWYLSDNGRVRTPCGCRPCDRPPGAADRRRRGSDAARPQALARPAPCRTWPSPVRPRSRSTSRAASCLTRTTAALADPGFEREARGHVRLARWPSGPSYRFSTDVLGEGELDGAVWRGDVVLKGYGDPTLVHARPALAGLPAPLAGNPAGQRARRRATSPISTRGARGRAGSRTSSSTSRRRSRLSSSTAAVSRAPTRQPALAAALSFRAALLRAGITVAGRAMTATADRQAVPLATIDSVPLQRSCASWTTRATTSRPRCCSSSSEPALGATARPRPAPRSSTSSLDGGRSPARAACGSSTAPASRASTG